MIKEPDYLARILVVEDNLDIGELVVDYLSGFGHVIDYATNGKAGLQFAKENEYDCIVLDLALPGIDGLEVCRKLREEEHSSVPILMLTARDTLDDKLDGFEVGADDYLVKPFELPELLARIEALWRRSRRTMDTRIKVADMTLDTETFEVSRQDQRIALNPVRFKLLKLLMQQSHRVVSRNEIETAIWGDEPTDSDSLRTHLSALRQAIDRPFENKLLHTIHGVGYRLYDNTK